MSTERNTHEVTVNDDRGAAPPSVTRKAYQAPRIERRIPIAANTLQPTSGNQSVLPEE